MDDGLRYGIEAQEGEHGGMFQSVDSLDSV